MPLIGNLHLFSTAVLLAESGTAKGAGCWLSCGTVPILAYTVVASTALGVSAIVKHHKDRLFVWSGIVGWLLAWTPWVTSWGLRQVLGL